MSQTTQRGGRGGAYAARREDRGYAPQSETGQFQAGGGQAQMGGGQPGSGQFRQGGGQFQAGGGQPGAGQAQQGASGFQAGAGQVQQGAGQVQAAGEQTLGDMLTGPMRMALMDFVRSAEVCEWCADQCIAMASEEMVECARLCRDVADVALLNVRLLSRGSPFGPDQAARFVDAAEACAAECERHREAHCQECARVLRRAVSSTRDLLESVGRPMESVGRPMESVGRPMEGAGGPAAGRAQAGGGTPATGQFG